MRDGALKRPNVAFSYALVWTQCCCRFTLNISSGLWFVLVCGTEKFASSTPSFNIQHDASLPSIVLYTEPVSAAMQRPFFACLLLPPPPPPSPSMLPLLPSSFRVQFMCHLSPMILHAMCVCELASESAGSRVLFTWAFSVKWHQTGN